MYFPQSKPLLLLKFVTFDLYSGMVYLSCCRKAEEKLTDNIHSVLIGR